MVEQARDDKRGWKAIGWTSGDRGQQINNQPLMGVAEAGRDIAVKAKAVPAVNGAFCCRIDHGGAEKLASMAGQQ